MKQENLTRTLALITLLLALFAESLYTQEIFVTTEDRPIKTHFTNHDSFFLTTIELFKDFDEAQFYALFDSTLLVERTKVIKEAFKSMRNYMTNSNCTISYYSDCPLCEEFTINFGYNRMEFRLTGHRNYKISSMQLYSTTPELASFSFPEELIELTGVGGLIYEIRDFKIMELDKLRSIATKCDSLRSFSAISDIEFSIVIEKLRLVEIVNQIEKHDLFNHKQVGIGLEIEEKALEVLYELSINNMNNAKILYSKLSFHSRRNLERYVNDLKRIDPKLDLFDAFKSLKK